jgi:hypothetical protein
LFLGPTVTRSGYPARHLEIASSHVPANNVVSTAVSSICLFNIWLAFPDILYHLAPTLHTPSPLLLLGPIIKNSKFTASSTVFRYLTKCLQIHSINSLPVPHLRPRGPLAQISPSPSRPPPRNPTNRKFIPSYSPLISKPTISDVPQLFFMLAPPLLPLPSLS